MSKHTPGPWRIYDCGTIGSASVRIPGSTDVILPGTVKGATIGEAMCNARLIAAAPDLLAACRKAEPILDQYIDDQCERGDTPTDVAIVLVEMRHAIARAEGEPCPPN
jgi:hypothetical protein